MSLPVDDVAARLRELSEEVIEPGARTNLAADGFLVPVALFLVGERDLVVARLDYSTLEATARSTRAAVLLARVLGAAGHVVIAEAVAWSNDVADGRCASVTAWVGGRVLFARVADLRREGGRAVLGEFVTVDIAEVGAVAIDGATEAPIDLSMARMAETARAARRS